MDGYDNIYGPDIFVDEFCKNVFGLPKDRVFSPEAPKPVKQYVKWLQRSLKRLDKQGKATTRLKEFEKLSGTDDIYSARYPNTKKNPRIATVYKGNIIKNLIMDCQSYTKYRPNETTGGIFVSWRRKEELPTGA